MFLISKAVLRLHILCVFFAIGTWTSYIFLSHPASDLLGRRYAALTGTVTVAVGNALECSARGPGAYAMMVAGRIICGMGVGIVSTSVPLYQSEVAPAGERGKYVVLNHVGLPVAARVGYGITFWSETEYDISISWRVSLAVILIPCFIFCGGLPFLPESPRWLVEHDHYERARRSLRWLREGSFADEQIEIELTRIREDMEEYKASGTNWLSLFRNRNLFNRLWRASLLQFMAQMCGATAMKYYLPTLLTKLGVSTRITLLIGGIESTLKIGMTIIDMFLIDSLGRRATLVGGCIAMGLGMLINGVFGQAYPDNSNRAADIVCIIFIFIYALGYSMGFGPAAWVYGSEVVRARGLNFSASGGAIGSIVTAQVWPVGNDKIGSRIYFYFMSINFACIPSGA
ncbi:hypothetical protein DL762_005760 [Monosporascus cannonballus]|uniref:Major facilitator superfamily (MFS) profile domain-containing protein n=1 Tax=Monosporascus cannonballus TaxID=155416 RepID=A0ABY0H537_9PEZI|nr:hypothetical protein DL762_005760 [Monosporascus cannonballus]